MLGFGFFARAAGNAPTSVSWSGSLAALNNVATSQVYLRDGWEGEWTLQPNLFCQFCTWKIAPEYPVAELHWRYGYKFATNEAGYEIVSPLSTSVLSTRSYVMIKINSTESGGTPLYWFGMLGHLVDDQGATTYHNVSGSDYPVRTGRQRIACVGLEKLLSEQPLTFAKVWDDTTSATLSVRRALTFNETGCNGTLTGNRSLTKHSGCYLFSNLVREDEQFWQIPDIVEYLLKHHPPSTKLGVNNFDFTISADDLALLGAGQYRPHVPTEGRSIKQILDQLVSRQYLYGYYLEASPLSDTITLRIVSFAHRTIASNARLLALPNTNPINVNFETNLGTARLDTSHYEPVSRVRVRGERVRVVCTLSHEDTTLVKNWSDAQETTFEAAASGQGGYSALTSEQKQRANEIARSVLSVRDVFASWKLPDDWIGQAGDGLGGGLSSILPPALANPDEDPAQNYSTLYQREVYLLPTLPLLSGYDYTGNSGEGQRLNPTAESDGPYLERRPLVLIADADEKYYDVAQIGAVGQSSDDADEESFSWSADVHVPIHERMLILQVQGEPQHILGKVDFTPLADDPELGRWDWQTMLVTVAVELAAYCEGTYPPFDQVAFDVLREKVFYSHGEHRLDWLHPYTVVGVNPTGTLQTNSTGGYLRDDRQQLEERAKLIYEWFKIPRRNVEFSTTIVNNEILLGAMIRFWGHAWTTEINGVVDTITFESPSGTLETPPEKPTIRYSTSFANLPEFYQ